MLITNLSSLRAFSVLLELTSTGQPAYGCEVWLTLAGSNDSSWFVSLGPGSAVWLPSLLILCLLRLTSGWRSA